MKKIYLLVMTIGLLMTTGCHNSGPVYRPVDFVADSLVHDDVPKAEDGLLVNVEMPFLLGAFRWLRNDGNGFYFLATCN